METVLERIENRVANRPSIAERFGTDGLVTHRILQNINYNFIKENIANNDGDLADQLWKDSHPFKCSAHFSRDFSSFDLDFIEKYFDVFATTQFWTSAGWELNEKTNRMEWTYKSGYVTEAIENVQLV